jgi:hypothetical protein
MHFLAPWMLLGAFAAAIPLAIHLIQRSRPIVVPWAAMEFLLRSIKQTQAASRLRDMILLLCRILVLVLAALALARPNASFVPASGPVDAVILFDLSRSMKTLEGTGTKSKTRFEMAREKTAELLARFPSGSRVRLVPFADRPLSELSDMAPRDPQAISDALSRLRPTDLGTNLVAGLEEAAVFMRQANLAQKQIHIISDAGAEAWRSAGPFMRTLPQRLPEETLLHWVKIGTPVPTHIQVLELSPVSGMVLSGRRQAWRVRLRNPGTEPVRDIALTLTAPLQNATSVPGEGAGTAEELAIAELGPGEERIVHLELLLDNPGFQPVEAVARFQGCRLDADGRLARVAQAREKYRVLLVEETSKADPTRGNSVFTAAALRSLAGENPENAATFSEKAERVLIEVRGTASLGTGLLGGIDLVLLCGNDPSRFDAGFTRDLSDWCGAGRVVSWLLPSAATRPLSSSDPFLSVFPKVAGGPIAAAAGLQIDPATATGWLGEFSRPPLDRIGRSRIQKIQAMTVTSPPASNAANASANEPQAEVLLRLSDGSPAMIVAPWKKGQIVTSNVGFDTGDTDFPLGPMFVPWTGALVAHAEEWASRPRNLAADQSAPSLDSASKTSQLRGPADQVMSGFGAEPPPRLLSAGIWKLEEGGVPVPNQVWAVSADQNEGGDLDPATAAMAREAAGETLNITEVGGQGTNLAASIFEGGEMAGWILSLVLLLLLAEGVVAWWASKPL